jgi:transcriptional regulator with XRE-family HTH domain
MSPLPRKVTEMKRSIRSQHGPKSPDAVDRHVGQRIRAQRMLLGLSQTQVADRLDVTFQQVQKYERGVNRVGAGRLNQIATILGVPVTFFYEGAPGSEPETKRAGADSGMGRMTSFLATREGSQMMSGFLQIRNDEIREGLLGLISALSASPAAKRAAASD